MIQSLRALLGAFAVLAIFSGLANPAAAETAEREVSVSDRSSLSIAVYNSDLALIKDTRRVALDEGANRIAIVDVSGQLRAESAILTAADGGRFQVTEQNFEFDQITPEALLRKNVGRSVRIVRTHPTTGEDREEIATVLSAANGVVLKVGDRIETGIPGRIVFDSVPAGLRAKPTLVALIDSAEKTTTPFELSYLTGGLRWQADYIAELDKDEKRLDLRVLATLVNTSGSDYKNARLQLVAGDVHQTGGGRYLPESRTMAKDMARAVPAEPEIAAQKVSEFQVFPFPRPVTLADNQSKQLALMSAQGVKVAKEYEMRSYMPVGRSERIKPPVIAWLKFFNKEEDGLGKPLPTGTVRVYQQQAKGASLFLGEDHIGHTPKNEKVRLNMGKSFDLTAERKQVAYTREGLGKNVLESTFELTLKNGDKEAATVKVIEGIPGEWTMISSSQPHKKRSASEAEWTIEVPAEGEAKLTYRVRVRYR